MGRPIYVECRIRAPMEELWRATQTPELHERWDLRFTSITYLPRPDAREPQRFRYETRLGFGIRIVGAGETVGERRQAGVATSALKFWSDDAKSLIAEGSGYWQYRDDPGDGRGLRFITLYDYRARFGIVGRAFDTVVFRPLMGWATAWSFDRLRLWLERGVDPTLSMLRWIAHAVCRVSLSLIWVYQGLVPKLLTAQKGELAMLRAAGVWPGQEANLLRAVGAFEVLFGLALLVLWRARRLYLLAAALLMVLGASALATNPAVFVAPFNPPTLTLAMLSLALLGFIAASDLPTASTCLRVKPRSDHTSPKEQP